MAIFISFMPPCLICTLDYFEASSSSSLLEVSQHISKVLSIFLTANTTKISLLYLKQNSLKSLLHVQGQSCSNSCFVYILWIKIQVEGPYIAICNYFVWSFHLYVSTHSLFKVFFISFFCFSLSIICRGNWDIQKAFNLDFA